MLRHLCCALSFSTLIGCPYISANTLELQLCKVDEDGDGDPKNICTADGVIAIVMTRTRLFSMVP